MGGEFVVVARTAGWAPVVAMPGQGSDRPGRVTIYRKDGTSCGSVEIPLLSSYTLDYDEVRQEASVGRPPLRIWDLTRCGSGG